MIFKSTRDNNLSVSFSNAIRHCMPLDGGFYVPSQTEDLRKWILYTDENTSFSSIAGSLTSAFIREEFSPIICETIATKAFKFSPELHQLDENLFSLELFHGPTGNHKDFGVAYLVSALETIFELQGGSAVFLDVTVGPLGKILAKQIKNKKNLKAVLVYPKGCVKGLEESDFIWNGGNILPIEIDGTEEDCHKFVKKVFEDNDFVLKNNLTVANTANIGCLLPQAFFYPFAFSRIKNKIHSDIYYALAPENYSNVVAGLYSWQFALPLNGFILPATSALTVDVKGNPLFLDSFIPMKDRELSNPSVPCNLERMEEVFSANELMMKHFVYPVKLTESDITNATKELYMKYKVFADYNTSKAYAASKLHLKNQDNEYSAVVLVYRDDPSFSKDYILQTIGELPSNVKNIKEDAILKLNKKLVSSVEELKILIESVTK